MSWNPCKSPCGGSVRDCGAQSAVLRFEHHRGGARKIPAQRHRFDRSGVRYRMEFKQLVDTAEKWCTGNPFDLIFAEEDDERRLDFYAEPGISFYVLCPDNMTGGTDNFVSSL